MKRLLITLGLLALMAAPAFGATYYVNPTGDDAADGSSGTPWLTIGKANATVAAGDVVNIANGTYTDAINPAVSGSAGSRITFVGNLSTPNQVQCPGGTINASYVTIKGCRMTSGMGYRPDGNFSWVKPSFDSLYKVVIIGGLDTNGLYRSMLSNVTVGNDSVNAQFAINSNEANWAVKTAATDTVTACTFKLRNLASTCGLLFTIHGLDVGDRVDSLVFSNNNIKITASPLNGTECQPVGIYRMSYAKFTSNIWTSVDSTTDATVPHRTWRMRDESNFNKFTLDSTLVTNPGGGATWIELTDSGHGFGHGHGNRWDQCWFSNRSNAWSNYGPISVQDGMNADTLSRCTFLTETGTQNSNPVAAFTFSGGELGGWGPSVIDHCTFYNKGSGGALMIAPATWNGSLVLTNNIYYCQRTTTTINDYAFRINGLPPGHLVTANNNLYSHYGGSARSINANGTLFSPNGYTLLAEVNSIYGSPKFVDSTTAAFSPALGAGSAALTTGFGGSDIGARQSTSADVTAPSQMTLAITQTTSSSITVSWLSPGDDAGSGTALGYEIHVSTADITSEPTFQAGWAVLGPVPAVAGTTQSVTIGNLSPNTRYYIAARAVDDAGNKGTLSSSVNSLTTQLPLNRGDN